MTNSGIIEIFWIALMKWVMRHRIQVLYLVHSEITGEKELDGLIIHYSAWFFSCVKRMMKY